MVRVGGDTSDGVGFCGVCIVFLTVVLNPFDLIGGDIECVLARSPSEVGMVKHYEGCVSVWYNEGVVSVGIMPVIFARVTRCCLHGAKRI